MQDNLQIKIIPKRKRLESKFIYFNVSNIPSEVLKKREPYTEDVDNVIHQFYYELFNKIRGQRNIKILDSLEMHTKENEQNNTFFTLNKESTWELRLLFKQMGCKGNESKATSNITKGFMYQDSEFKEKKLILRLIRQCHGNKSQKDGSFMVFHIFESEEIKSDFNSPSKNNEKLEQNKQVHRNILSFFQNQQIKKEINESKKCEQNSNQINKTQRNMQDPEEQFVGAQNKNKQPKQCLISSDSDSPKQSLIQSQASYSLESEEPDYQPLSSEEQNEGISNSSSDEYYQGKLKNNMNFKRQNPIKSRFQQRSIYEKLPSKQLKVNETLENNQYLQKSSINQRENSNQLNNFILIDEEESIDIDQILFKNNQKEQQYLYQSQQHNLIQCVDVENSQEQNLKTEQQNPRNYAKESNPIIEDITSQEAQREKEKILQNKKLKKELLNRSLLKKYGSQEIVESSSYDYIEIQPMTQQQSEPLKVYSTPQQQWLPKSNIRMSQFEHRTTFNEEEQQIQQNSMSQVNNQLQQNNNSEQQNQNGDRNSNQLFQEIPIEEDVEKEKNKFLKNSLHNNQNDNNGSFHMDGLYQKPNSRLRQMLPSQRRDQQFQNREMINSNDQMFIEQTNSKDDEGIDIDEKERKKPSVYRLQQHLNHLQKKLKQPIKLEIFSDIEERRVNKDQHAMLEECQQQRLSYIQNQINNIKREDNEQEPIFMRDLSNRYLQHQNFQLQTQLLDAHLSIQDHVIRENESNIIKAKLFQQQIRQQKIETALKYQITLLQQKQGKEQNPVILD